MSLTEIQALALAVAKLDDEASKWTESDAMEVSQVTDEHLRSVLDLATSLRTSAQAVVDCAGRLMMVRARDQKPALPSDINGTGAEYWLDGWRLYREHHPFLQPASQPQPLGGDRLLGYVACARAQARGEALDNDNAFRIWTRKS